VDGSMGAKVAFTDGIWRYFVYGILASASGGKIFRIVFIIVFVLVIIAFFIWLYY
jgi:hypothetical protein